MFVWKYVYRETDKPCAGLLRSGWQQHFVRNCVKIPVTCREIVKSYTVNIALLIFRLKPKYLFASRCPLQLFLEHKMTHRHNIDLPPYSLHEVRKIEFKKGSQRDVKIVHYDKKKKKKEKCKKLKGTFLQS